MVQRWATGKRWIYLVAGGVLLFGMAACGAAEPGSEKPTISPEPATPSPLPPDRDASPSPLPASPSPDQPERTATPSPAPAATPTSLPRLSEPPVPGDPLAPPYGAALDALIDAARADLAQRKGVAPEEVELVDLRSVVWPDTALGCPRPGFQYLQVQVEGALIRLRIANAVYQYHTDGRRTPFLCEQ